MNIQPDPRFTTWRVKWGVILGWYDGMADGLWRIDDVDAIDDGFAELGITRGPGISGDPEGPEPAG